MGDLGLFVPGNNALSNSSLLLVSWSPEGEKKNKKQKMHLSYYPEPPKDWNGESQHQHPVKVGGRGGGGSTGLRFPVKSIYCSLVGGGGALECP